MQDIRVLHIGLSSNVGGIESVVHSWLKYKPEWLHFDFIQVGEEPLAFKEEFINSGSKVYKITPRANSVKRSNYDLKRIIAANEYDYVQHHLMTFSWPEPTLIAAMCKKTLPILHAHTVISNRFEWKYKLLHKIGKFRLRNTHYLEIACSDEAGHAMFDDSKYMVINNGIDFESEKYDEEERKKTRERLGLSEYDYVIGHVGRSSFEKNYPYLIKTFSELSKQDQNAKLLLIGDILNDKEIQTCIEENGIRESTICTGKVSNVCSYYSAMDVFFLPSIIEGVSVSLLEAQASGLPCVVSENVSREAKISDCCEFIPMLNEESTAEYLENVRNKQYIRSEVKLDESYDSRKSSEALFEFYLHNLER